MRKFVGKNELDEGEKPISLLTLKDYELMDIINDLTRDGYELSAGDRDHMFDQLSDIYDYYVEVEV